jgi:dihydroorotate dehydrogenase
MSEYASEAETDALIVKDTRTDNMKMLDKVLDERGANEQGVDSYPILYQIALELIEHLRGDK